LKTKTYKLNISRQIDTNFRNYALYVLENRGIPSFYDGLTNVQRIILLNSPHSFNKSLSVVGSCITDGYHHGDKSLTGAINKLARPFGNSEQLLLGDGFFGSPVNHEASAARYTSVKINPKIAEMIRKNSFLNEKNDEGSWNPLHLDLPIGLSNTIVGIAVGYATTVLPRDLNDVQKYLDGKIKEVKPKFKNFNGKVSRYKGLDKSWVIEGVSEVNPTTKTIRITELPPLMKYGSFLKKIESLIEKYSIKLTNNSQANVDVLLQFTGVKEEWPIFVEAVQKSIKMLVTETPVFVKDGMVLEYNRIEDYIDDYRYRLAEIAVKRVTYFKQVNEDELNFNIFKEKYLLFMLDGKKKGMYSDEEVEKFLKDLTKGYPNIKRRLESIYLKSLTEQELERTRELIKTLTAEIEKQKIELKEVTDKLNSMTDTSISRGTQNKASSVNLFIEEDEIDGIEVFGNKETENEYETQNEYE
jgi:DNA gyrase/topoisomerase IV subunit A